jgi:hypothetical protein
MSHSATVSFDSSGCSDHQPAIDSAAPIRAWARGSVASSRDL